MMSSLVYFVLLLIWIILIPKSPSGNVEARAYLTPPVTFRKHLDWAVCNDCNFHNGALNYYWHRIWTWEDCLKTCIWYGSECSHWVFQPYPRYCWLKTGRVHFDDSYPDHNKNLHGGIRCSLVKTGNLKK